MIEVMVGVILRQFQRSTVAVILVVANYVAPDGFNSVQKAPKSLALGLRPRPSGGDHSASLDPLAASD